jgi:hypothetical protein
MAKVYKFRRARFPSSAAPCLDKLAAHAHTGEIEGAAFVCILRDGAYIADTCGTATDQPNQVRTMLQALDAKIANRQMRARR